MPASSPAPRCTWRCTSARVHASSGCPLTASARRVEGAACCAGRPSRRGGCARSRAACCLRERAERLEARAHDPRSAHAGRVAEGATHLAECQRRRRAGERRKTKDRQGQRAASRSRTGRGPSNDGWVAAGSRRSGSSDRGRGPRRRLRQDDEWDAVVYFEVGAPCSRPARPWSAVRMIEVVSRSRDGVDVGEDVDQHGAGTFEGARRARRGILTRGRPGRDEQGGGRSAEPCRHRSARDRRG